MRGAPRHAQRRRAAAPSAVTSPESTHSLSVTGHAAQVCMTVCNDHDESCKGWTKGGECETNKAFMHRVCPCAAAKKRGDTPPWLCMFTTSRTFPPFPPVQWAAASKIHKIAVGRREETALVSFTALVYDLHDSVEVAAFAQKMNIHAPKPCDHSPRIRVRYESERLLLQKLLLQRNFKK